MKRREFIKSSILIASSGQILNSCNHTKQTTTVKDHISGFIFSDAHIGWKGPEQPTVQQQSNVIQTIKQNFQNLDLVFDTGDIHHGYLNENERNIARNQWLSLMANPFSKSMFSYVPGNHELGKGPTDEEMTACSIGSQNLRPYSSFNYKGIHFILLPQLLDTILVNRESIDWLEHDLLINKDKSTLIFSHNSIQGTTFSNGENGYRTVINSEKLLEVINKHGNVLSWFHGHNHHYEIVKKHNRLYVSNGRIGGFNPPESWGKYGQGHLGGIYFEVNKKGLRVDCYSATKNKFLKNLGYPQLSNQLNIETSFNPDEKVSYYFGHGSLTNNVNHTIHNHYLSKNNIEVNTKILEDLSLNDNSNFELTTELFFTGKKIKRIIGYKLIPKDLQNKTVNNGLEIANPDQKTITIKLPDMKPGKKHMKRASYFRCESGDLFKTEFKIISKEPNELFNPLLRISYTIYDKNQNQLFKSKSLDIKHKNGTFIHKEIKVPTIGLTEYLEKEKYLHVSYELVGSPKEFVLNHISLSKLVENNKQNELKVNQIKYPIINNKNIVITNKNFQNNGKSSIVYQGTNPMSCIIKIPDIDWQVRNAMTNYTENSIDFLNYRHNYQVTNEVVIVSFGNRPFYLNKIIDIMPLKVSYTENKINVDFTSINQHSKLIFHISKIPKNIHGSSKIDIKGSNLTIIPESKQIEILF